MNLKIVDAYDDHIIGSKSFEKVMMSPSDEMTDVVVAFDDALGKPCAARWSGA